MNNFVDICKVNTVDLNQDDLFVAFSMPASTNISLYVNDGTGENRFVIHPFIRHKVQTTHISTKEIIHNPNFSFSTTLQNTLTETTKNEYLKQADYLLNQIKVSSLKKVILSRIKQVPLFGPNFVDLFHSLVNAYPKAFTYFFNIPGQGTWMGASPEVLLKNDPTGFETVALAGTLAVRKNEAPQWTTKEKEEQQIIVDYVKEKLAEQQINFQLEGPRSSRAGNIYHLKSIFHSEDAIDPVELALALHPGPAISGYPIQSALQLISQTEQHDRAHYCGFLGPISQDSSSLFINLRCMQVFSDSLSLYVGGGYTKDSNPENEWIETELKSQTLLSVIHDSYIEANGIK